MQRLVAAGGRSANTPREAAKNVSYMIVMVANHTQATSLLFDEHNGAVGGLKAGATIIISSTVAPAYMAQLTRLLHSVMRSDVQVIDAPVSGGAHRAANGTLSIFSSGSATALSAPHVQSILSCLSDTEKLYRVPGGLGGGSSAKLIHQIFAGVNIAMASEAMGLAAMAGLDTAAAFAELSAGEGWSWMFGNRGPHMLDAGLGRYSAVGIIAKDVGIIAGTAREHRVPLPVLASAEQLYAWAISAGWGALDDCVVVRLYLGNRPDLVAERAGKAAKGSGQASMVAVEEIRDLMVGVHLAGMCEAMAFCERLGIGAELMYDIVSNAAGASRVFEKYFRDLKEGKWCLKGVEGVEGVRERLVSRLLVSNTFSVSAFHVSTLHRIFFRRRANDGHEHS